MQTQYIALAWFLILVTIGVIIVLSIAIAVKRGVARRKSRIDRNFHTPYGYGLSKVWKESVERRINNTVRVRTEPQVLGEYYQKEWDRLMEEKKVTFLYRAKAVDEFLKLKENILTLCPNLEAPPIRGIHGFLMAARDCAMRPAPPRGKIEEYCRLYLWARHDMNTFGIEQYEQFCKVHNDLMQYVNRAVAALSSGQVNTSGSSSRRGSSKLFSFNSRNASNSKSPRPMDPLTKSHDRRSSISDPVSIDSAQVHRRNHPSQSRTPADSIMYHEPDNGTTNVGYTSRRGSCQSDGSETALIDLHPLGHMVGHERTRRRSRSSDRFETIELRPMFRDPSHPSTSSADRPPHSDPC